MYKKALWFVLMLLLLVSCTRQASDSPRTEGELPDMILRNASYTFGRPDEDPLVMKAGTITIYGGNTRTILENVSFTQKDELEGTCDYAESHDENNVTLKGNVHVHKKSDNLTIDCDNLLWDDSEQTMSTDGTVHLVYKDGTELTAEGFTAMLETNTYEFRKITQGVFTEE